MFGTIRQSSWIKTESTSYSLSNSEFLKTSAIGGLYAKLGAQYEHKLSKAYTIRLGATANLKQNITAEQGEYWISHPFYASDTSGSDTSYHKNGVKEKITLPSSFNVGIQLAHSDKWNLNLNYQHTNWSQFNNRGNKDSIGTSAHKISVGGEYTPNSLSFYNYWQRVSYRAGFYFGKDYVSVNNYQMSYYAATFGLSIPFKRAADPDRIHTSIEIGKMGKQITGGIQQNFIRFSVGLSFSNSTWFKKRKYE
jgi:hypothetical protein